MFYGFEVKLLLIPENIRLNPGSYPKTDTYIARGPYVPCKTDYKHIIFHHINIHTEMDFCGICFSYVSNNVAYITLCVV